MGSAFSDWLVERPTGARCLQPQVRGAFLLEEVRLPGVLPQRDDAPVVGLLLDDPLRAAVRRRLGHMAGPQAVAAVRAGPWVGGAVPLRNAHSSAQDTMAS